MTCRIYLLTAVSTKNIRKDRRSFVVLDETLHSSTAFYLKPPIQKQSHTRLPVRFWSELTDLDNASISIFTRCAQRCSKLCSSRTLRGMLLMSEAVYLSLTDLLLQESVHYNESRLD